MTIKNQKKEPKKLSKSSLVNRLRLGFVLLGFSSVLLSGGIQSYLSWQEHLTQLQKLQQERSRSASEAINLYMDDLQRKLSYLSRIQGLMEMTPSIKQQLLTGITRHNDAYEYIAIADATGKIVTSVSPYEPVTLDSIAGTPLFNRTFKQQEEYIAPVEINPATNLPMTTFSVPLRNSQNEVAGVLLARVNLAFLWFILSQTDVGKTGYIYILDRQQRLIAETGIQPENFKLKPIANSELWTTIEKMEDGNFSESYQGLRKVSVLGHSKIINTTQWYLVAELPTQEAYAPLHQSVWIGSIVLFIITTGAGGLGLLIARSIVSPLKRLTEAANAISEGNFKTVVDIKTNNELGVLAKAFNQMTQQVQELIQVAETEREVAETALANFQQAQSKLIQSEKMSSLGQLVAGVAHEINNPVNFIYGNLVHTHQYSSDLLELVKLYQEYYPHPNPEIEEKIEDIDLEFLYEDLPNMLDSMKVGANRIRDIVLSLRNFSRLDESEFKAADLHEGINNTLMILNNRLKAKSDHPPIEVIKDYGELPLVECYAGQLNQVFMNFLANAIDAIEERNHELSLEERHEHPNRISITTRCHENETVTVAIADTGKGIDETTRLKLFTPFFTTKPIGRGTGLGLSISYQIVVDKHGGEIHCESELEQGTTFTIILPLRIHPKQALVATGKSIH